MRRDRIVTFAFIILLTVTIIGARTAYLLLDDSSNVASSVSNQIDRGSTLFYPRGRIMDRNGIVLSPKVNKKEGEVPIKEYVADVGEDVVGKVSYNPEDTTAEGIKGESGLQALYDSALNGGSPIKISTYRDGRNEEYAPIFVQVYGDHVNEGTDLVTTLNYHIQKIVEDELDFTYNKEKYEGIAVVVSDVHTGEVLSMASVGDLTNKAVLNYQPGSVFKILVFAQALEKGIIDLNTIFECKGTIEIDGKIKNCNKSEGHGKINTVEAFAESCNIAAYETGMLLNQFSEKDTLLYNDVLELAKEFGFQDKNVEKTKEFPLSYSYSAPIIPSKISVPMDVFNMSLGQGSVMASPLMMTKIVQTIGNDGVLIEPTIALKEVSPLGQEKEMKKVEKQIFSKEVNDTLKILLTEVGKTGTGKNNTLKERGGLAGKSGTAQHIGEREAHSWFTGYFPANNPKYAMTIFVEEGGSSSTTALPIFDSVANKILDLYE
ncbi:penicillin-binding transpeptidase domain-containing protein [Alkalibaculum bacchi]|uniref:penicillin-binding transpeptidase domain-containing protein n=1 Tax=Alkalibaculum bacchi TaxID=645887 RepID=UPI0026EF1876|nr:penicillin-binding transpeptidase domain-containing protein [Alkalibaculum bacchi]